MPPATLVSVDLDEIHHYYEIHGLTPSGSTPLTSACAPTSRRAHSRQPRRAAYSSGVKPPAGLAFAYLFDPHVRGAASEQDEAVNRPMPATVPAEALEAR